MKRTILRITFIIGAILLLSQCATVPLTGRRQLILFPEDQMVSMSLTSYSSFLKENKLSTDVVNKQRIKNVGARISKAVEQYLAANGLQDQIANFEWEFPYCQNDAGIAVVMGHEIAHAVAHHSNERMSQEALIQYGQAAATEILGHNQSDSRKAILAAAIGMGTNVGIVLPFSADEKRIARLKAAIPEALKYKRN